MDRAGPSASEIGPYTGSDFSAHTGRDKVDSDLLEVFHEVLAPPIEHRLIDFLVNLIQKKNKVDPTRLARDVPLHDMPRILATTSHLTRCTQTRTNANSIIRHFESGPSRRSNILFAI